ncbi:hypothetical protein BST47_23130 [Mycolicibacterium tusciae]|uniref:Uncharacterized protein n=1 Tax=Mycolicibacterium tusciae TaxID=75922 RepID=A0A1X0JI07_9MYCO|nr:hypothetical protein BST47_23130 [Mycolicibacterium tusciae]
MAARAATSTTRDRRGRFCFERVSLGPGVGRLLVVVAISPSITAVGADSAQQGGTLLITI